MRKLLGISALVVSMGAGTAASAFAVPFEPYNDRQVGVNGPPGSEISLQTALNSIFAPLSGVYGIPNVTTDQSEAGLWGLATSPGGMVPALAFEQAGNAGINTYGIWSWSDTLGIVQVPIFLGGATPTNVLSATAFLTWTDPTTVVIGGFNCGVWVNCDPTMNTSYYADSSAFGFYLQTGANTYYTVDSLNPGGSAKALAYQQSSTTNWAIAFEDGTDGDYNDGVLRVESLKPVPEPASVMLFGTGLIGAFGAFRKRIRRS